MYAFLDCDVIPEYRYPGCHLCSTRKQIMSPAFVYLDKVDKQVCYGLVALEELLSSLLFTTVSKV